MSAEPKKVYSAISLVTQNLAKEGIAKDRKNEQQGYKFRGIDDVYNALAAFLAEAKLCILPNVLSREVTERTSAKGSVLLYVTVKVDFSFVSAEDGSEHHVVTYGEAMDSGDKATNKAMSAAYKYAAMQAFCIPTEGDNDADAHTHELKSAGRNAKPRAAQQPVKVRDEDRPQTDERAKVTQEQIEAIHTAMSEANVDIAAILAKAELTDLAEMAAEDAPKAITWIKRQKKA